MGPGAWSRDASVVTDDREHHDEHPPDDPAGVGEPEASATGEPVPHEAGAPDGDHVHEHDEHDHEHDGPEDDPAARARLDAALAALDDDAIAAGLARMGASGRTELARALGLPKAAASLGTGLAPLVRRKLAVSGADRRLASAFALTEGCNEATIAALGDRSQDPSRDDMLGVLPAIVSEHGAPITSVLLASYGLTDAPCRDVFTDLLTTEASVAIGPPVATDPTARAAGPGTARATGGGTPDPDAEARKEARRQAKAERKAAERARADARVAAEAKRRADQHAAKRTS